MVTVAGKNLDRKTQEELMEFLNAPKYLLNDPQLMEVNDRLLLVSSLFSQNVAFEGYQFRIKVSKKKPNQSATIQMERQFKNIKKFFPFIRLEWNPSNTHTNPSCIKPDELANMRIIHKSHIHHPDENFWQNKSLQLGIVKIAKPLDKNPENWKTLMELTGKIFNITNLVKIEAPKKVTGKLVL